ncbi:MAG: hypothetical protein HZC38_14665 [Chloroflexi bacterium]|nr:hypothetical protein [Chloroflexota bacterium]
MTITHTTFFNRPAHQLVNDHFSLRRSICLMSKWIRASGTSSVLPTLRRQLRLN